MSNEKPEVDNADNRVVIRIDLWRALDVLRELDGDDYCSFRDAIIEAIREGAER